MEPKGGGGLRRADRSRGDAHCGRTMGKASVLRLATASLTWWLRPQTPELPPANDRPLFARPALSFEAASEAGGSRTRLAPELSSDGRRLGAAEQRVRAA
jgi:hypothetical protein